jgi:hypothetical protein
VSSPDRCVLRDGEWHGKNSGLCNMWLELCRIELYQRPGCVGKYKDAEYVKPDLDELNRRGTIKLNSKRSEVTNKKSDADALKLTIGQGFKDVLSGAFNKFKEDTTNHVELYCPSKDKNACDNPHLALAGGRLAIEQKDCQHRLEMCIVLLGRHTDCFERYETNGFLKSYLEDLAAND